MPKSTRQKKVKKPRPDFPLFPHRTGRWTKKVRGQFCYFGKVVDDPEGVVALERWLDQKDALLAGRKPRPKGEGPTLRDVVNQYLTYKTALVTSGELAPRTFERYHANAILLITTFGRDRLASDLRPDDFEALRSAMTKSWGPVAVANEIQMTRSLFRYGYEAGLLQSPVRFGPGFKKPSAKTIRQARAAGGPRLFTAKQIKAILKAASANMRAAVLLACNGGMGNTDLALLPVKAVKQMIGFLDYPRPKTGIPRRIPLWPETTDAIRKVLENRREPKDPEAVGLVFIGPRGESYVGRHRGYRLAQEFARLMDTAKVEGRTFYDFRRTFQTIAEENGDVVAVQSIMGHAPASADMSSIYRQQISDDRLRRVVDHVHTWLFGRTETK